MTLDLVKNYLSNEGFRWDEVNERAIHFRYQGMHMIFEEDPRDQSFFRMIMPNIYEIDGDRVKVLEACNTITCDMKVIKAFINDNELWISIEMFLDSSPEVEDFFDRCADILIEGWQRLKFEINK